MGVLPWIWMRSLLCAMGIVVALLCAARPSAAAMQAPGFIAGPQITAAGTLWLQAGGLMLSSKTGVGKRLSAQPILPITSPSSSFEAIASGSGVKAGKLGHSPRPLAPFGRCPPLSGGKGALGLQGRPLIALSGSTLYAVVDPRCLHRFGYDSAAVLLEPLGRQARGSWRLLTRAPSRTVAIAVAGARLALTYRAGASNRSASALATVAVYNAHSGRFIYRARFAQAFERPLALSSSVDESGDVLLTVLSSSPPPSTRHSSSWWATPAQPLAHPIPELVTGAQALPESNASGAAATGPLTAALSAGQLAYVTGGAHEGEKIEISSLRTGTHRLVARLQSEVAVLGLDLSGSSLTWAQQSTIPMASGGPTPGGGYERSCDVEPLGPPMIENANLRSLPAEGLLVGEPLPPADSPPCTEFES